MVDVTRTSTVEPATATDHQQRDHDRDEDSGKGGEEARPHWRTAHQILDVAQIMGIPAAELTPRVQEALGIVVSEFDRTRAELDRERERVAYYQDLADRDSILPVANRRALMRDLGRLINRAAHTRTVSSLAILSIRGLEQVRAVQGRTVVDGILGKVAEILSTGLRGSDALGYLGSGDFAVILTLTEGRQAEDKAQDLCLRMEAALKAGRAQGAWRVAWGIAPFEAGDAGDAVVEKADSDLRRREGAQP